MRRLVPITLFATISFVFFLGSSSSAKEPLHWYKGNLHTHSLWSDGNDFPEMIVDWYRRRGYHFLSLTDHNILSVGTKWIDADLPSRRGAIQGLERYLARFGKNWVETRITETKSKDKKGKVTVVKKKQVRLKALQEFRGKFEVANKFLLVQGEEITDSSKGLPIHINATNLKELIPPQRGSSVRDVMRRNLIAVEQQSQRIGQPIFAHLNHPNYGYSVTAEDLAAVVRERFVEVYNGHPSINHLGDKSHPGVERMWDIANTIRIANMKAPPLFGLATDDSHNYFGRRGSSPGRGWIVVQAPALTANELVKAIQIGRFYASSGVTLKRVEFDRGKKTLTIEIKPAKGATYVTEFIGTCKGYDKTTKQLKDKDGKPLRATLQYSASVGKVLAKVSGIRATYKLKGNEYYVRAVVTSTAAAENPSFQGQRKQAWTQPVGWRK